MKTTIAIAMLMLFAGLGSGLAGDDPPQTITLDVLQQLYEPVSFDHAMHSETFSCATCHHHTTGAPPEQQACRRCHEGGNPKEQLSCTTCHPRNDQPESSPRSARQGDYHVDIPGLKGALHLLCVDCHRKESGPTACDGCHAFTSAGRQRFRLAASGDGDPGSGSAGNSPQPKDK